MPPVFNTCYITDRHALAPRPLLPVIAEAIGAGVDLVQIREKDLATRDLLKLVDDAVHATAGTSTRVVVNDRLDVAAAAGAAGVHLGTHSLPAHIARQHAPDGFLIGVSCHSLEEAFAAERAKADYILLGPIFETPSKLAYGPPLGLEVLREVAVRVELPILALGGITVERVKRCFEAGAVGIAGISIFQSAPSLAARVGELRSQFP
ncbi:MAG: thiamine phosphate synthase [Terriglobia bacterium]